MIRDVSGNIKTHVQFAIAVQCYNSISLQIVASVEPAIRPICAAFFEIETVIFTMTKINTKGPQSAA